MQYTVAVKQMNNGERRTIEMLNRNPTNAEVLVCKEEENQPNASETGKTLYIYIFLIQFSKKTFRRRRVMEYYQHSLQLAQSRTQDDRISSL